MAPVKNKAINAMVRELSRVRVARLKVQDLSPQRARELDELTKDYLCQPANAKGGWTGNFRDEVADPDAARQSCLLRLFALVEPLTLREIAYCTHLHHTTIRSAIAQLGDRVEQVHCWRKHTGYKKTGYVGRLGYQRKVKKERGDG